MLTADEIKNQIALERLTIEPFDPTPTHEGGQLGPNSYDLRLGDKLYRLATGTKDGGHWLDFAQEPGFELVKPNARTVSGADPRPGFTLFPNEFYLGCTLERTHTPFHVPWIEGRSTCARYGLQVHMTAGRGDIDFNGHWTLELQNVTRVPMRIYVGMRICQISLFEPTGKIDPRYNYAGGYNTPKCEPKLPRPGNF